MFRWLERWLARRRMRKAVRGCERQEALKACEAAGGNPVRDVWIPMGERHRKRDYPSDARDCYTQAQYVEGLLAIGDACAADAHRLKYDREYAWPMNREDAVESFGEALRIVRKRLIAAGDECYSAGEIAMGDRAYETARMDIPPEKLRAFIKHHMGAALGAFGRMSSIELKQKWLMRTKTAETFARRLGEKELSLHIAMLYLRQGAIDKAVALAKDAGGEIPAEKFRETAALFLNRGELQIALQARSTIGEAYSREEILIAAADLRREGTTDDRREVEVLEAYAQGMEKR